jgi:putative DNA primase/helicase
MAKMKMLDPPLTVPLPAEGWELMATEAWRYAAGLVATVQAHNGTLQACQQVALAHPKQWTAFVQDVAGRSGCAVQAVVAAIHALMEAVEVCLRVHRTPPAQAKPDGVPAGPSQRPLVQVNGRFLRDIVTDAVAALAATNEPPTLFGRGSELVRVPPDAAHATPLSVAALRVLLDHAADFMAVRRDEDEGEIRIPARPPRDACESILAIPPRDAFPPLASIRSVPVILPDGRLLTTDGYDRDSGLLLRLHGLGGVSDDMPLQEAKSWLCHELLGDFPFADEASRAHSLALLLEPFVRPMMGGPTPLYLIDAPIRGAGKGLLADVACLIATGRKADVMALVRSDAEEHEKRITALLLAGAQWVLMDNATSLASAPLAAVLTATQWRGRRLGKSELVDVPNDATWVATGNNVTLSDEIARRTIPIRLDPGVERPEHRSGFSHPELAKWAGEHRSTLVSACLSFVRMWLDAGCPEGQTTLGSYESWARLLGGILGVSGVSGFLTGRERLYSEADRETADWCALCERWWLAYADHPMTAKDVFEVAKVNSLLLSVWGGRTALAAQQRFGHALAAMRDRVFGSLRVRSAGRDGQTGNAAYRIELVRDGGKTPETPETPLNHVRTQAAQGGSGGGSAGGLGADTTKTPGDVGCVTEPPAGSDQYIAHESKAYGVSGVSGVSGACCPTDSDTDEEVIDL